MIAKVVSPDAAPRVQGSYSPALRIGDWLFVSAQLGIDPETGCFEGESTYDQTRRALLNLAAFLQAAAVPIDRIVRVDVVVADIQRAHEVDKAFEEFFDRPFPTCQLWQAVLPEGARVQLSCIAYAVR